MIEFYETMSDAEKVICLQALKFVLLLENRTLKDNEKYLKKKMNEFGMSKALVSETTTFKTKEEFIRTVKKITSIRIKRFILREMVMIAVYDYEIKDDEIAALYELGLGVGINQEKINDFFLWVAQGIEWRLEGLKLVEEDI